MGAAACRRVARAAAAAVALALLAPATASGDTRALRLRFAEGRTLADAGRWADALDRFEEVARARPTPHVLFHIAACNDRLGRLQEAALGYRRARDAAVGVAPDVSATAEVRLAALEARMPRILVFLDGAVEGVSLLVDGAAADAATPVRVDPGPHVVVALRKGVPVAAAALSALERQTRVVKLRIYPAAPARGPAPTSPIARATPSR